jgi:hypothetical protein
LGIDLVAADEFDCAFNLDGLDCGIPNTFVEDELVVPDVTGSFVIDHLKPPGLALFEGIDLDREWDAVDDHMLAFAGGNQVWDPATW